MRRKPRMFSKANLFQVPLKNPYHQEKSIQLPCAPHWVASLGVGDHSHQAEQVPHIENQSSTKFSKLPGERTTSTPLSYPCKQAMAVPLPFHDHQSIAKSSSGYKYQSKATVLPLLCPEYKASATTVTLPCREKWVMPPLNHNELFEVLLDSSCWTETPSRHDHLPKMSQQCDHQTEELLQLNQRSTAAALTDRCRIELPAHPYSQARNTTVFPKPGFPGHKTKTVVKSTHLPNPPALLSESFSRQRTTMLPLPCLSQGSKATAKKTSALNLLVNTSAPKLCHPHLHSKHSSLLGDNDHHSRAGTALSLQNNQSSRETTILGSAYSQHYFMWSPSLHLQGTAIAKPSSFTKHQITPQTIPSRHTHSESGTGDCSPYLDHLDEAIFVPLSSPYNLSRVPKGPDYISKEVSSQSSNSDPQATPTLCFSHSAEVPSSLNHQAINSSGATHRVEVLKQDNRWATLQPISIKKTEVPSGSSQNDEVFLNCNYKEKTRPVVKQISITIPPVPDHHFKPPLCLNQQNIPPLVLSNHINIPRDLSNFSLIPLNQDHWAEMTLTSDEENEASVPNHLKKAALNTNSKAVSPVDLDQLSINSLDLHYQAPSLSDPNHQVPLPPGPIHQATPLSDSDHHAKDTLDTKVQSTLHSFLSHWKTLFPRLTIKATTPKDQNNQEPTWSDTTQLYLSHQVTTPESPDQHNEVIGYPNNTQSSCITASEYRSQVKGDPRNTQDSCITTSEYQSKSSQGDKHWVVPLPGPGHNTRALTNCCDPFAPVELSTDSHSEIQSQLQQQIQTVQITETTWCLKYIKPHVIEGGAVPVKIVNYIITSIPQEKIKSDIRKQILLRRMRSGAHQCAGRLSCSYKVCLACASWIPNGCYHGHAVKYSSQAQLLAIPTPVPGSAEEMGVRFVLQIPQAKAGSISNTDYPSSSELSLSCHSSLLPSSQSGTVPTKSSILRFPPREWINLLFDTDYQRWARKTSSSPGFKRKMSVKFNTTSQ